MTRVNRVNKTQQQRTCGKCGCTIEVGQPYVWWKFRFGGKRTRCAKAECAPKGSDLTQSEYLGNASDFEDRWADCDSVDTAREIADEIRDMGQEQEDKRSNMPDSLQDSDTGNLLQERADACNSTADEIESAADEAESNIDQWELNLDSLTKEEREEYEKMTEEQREEFTDKKREEYTEECISEMRDNVSLDFG